MPIQRRRIQIPVPYEGIDLQSSGHTLAPTFARQLTNFLVHEDNRLPMRAGIVCLADYIWSSSTPTAQARRWYGGWSMPVQHSRVAAAFKYNSGITSSLPPHQVFERGVVSHADTETGVITLLVDNVPTSTLLSGTAAGARMGMTYAQHKGFTYTIANTRRIATAIPYQGLNHYARSLIKWTNTTTTVEIGNDAPQAAIDLASYANRLWMLGGVEPGIADGSIGSAVLKPNTLWFTEADADPAVVVSGDAQNNWKLGNLATNPYNNIVVGAEVTGDWGVRLVPLDRSMLILKRYSTWLLAGSGTDSFALKKLSGDVGCTDPRSSVVVKGQPFWMSSAGLATYDGVDVKIVSARVNSNLNPIRQGGGKGGDDVGATQCWALPNDYILVQLVDDAKEVTFGSTYTYGELDPARQFLYHVPTDRWTNFQSKANQYATSILTANGGAVPTSDSEDEIVAISDVWMDKGKCHALGQDVYFELTGMTQPNLNTVAFSDGFIGKDQRNSVADDESDYAATATLPPVRPSGGYETSTIKRLIMEYQTLAPGLNGPYWEVALKRYTTTEGEVNVVSEYTGLLQAQLQNTNQVVNEEFGIQLAHQDMTEELIDFYLVLSRVAGIESGLDVANILGFTVEVEIPSHRPPF